MWLSAWKKVASGRWLLRNGCQQRMTGFNRVLRVFFDEKQIPHPLRGIRDDRAFVDRVTGEGVLNIVGSSAIRSSRASEATRDLLLRGVRQASTRRDRISAAKSQWGFRRLKPAASCPERAHKTAKLAPPDAKFTIGRIRPTCSRPVRRAQRSFDDRRS